MLAFSKAKNRLLSCCLSAKNQTYSQRAKRFIIKTIQTFFVCDNKGVTKVQRNTSNGLKTVWERPEEGKQTVQDVKTVKYWINRLRGANASLEDRDFDMCAQAITIIGTAADLKEAQACLNNLQGVELTKTQQGHTSKAEAILATHSAQEWSDLAGKIEAKRDIERAHEEALNINDKVDMTITIYKSSPDLMVSVMDMLEKNTGFSAEKIESIVKASA